MIDRHRQLLLDCYITGQVPEAAWQKHLADDPGLAELFEREHGEPQRIPEPALGARDRAFKEWDAKTTARPHRDADYAREVFKAGWNARKLADLRMGFGWRDKL